MCKNYATMSLKRSSQINNSDNESLSKIPRREDYFRSTLKDSGLIINHPPLKCVASEETVVIIRNIKKILQQHVDYPQNASKFYSKFEDECRDITIFKHYLFPNIVRITDDIEISLNDSIIKLLLCVPILQNKLVDYIFEKAIDLAAEAKCGPWIQMILKCFSGLDNIVDGEKISTHLLNLLDVTTEKMVRLEIVTAIPDIIGDQEHDSIAAEMSRIMSEDHDLIPAVLDCLSYLCLSEDQYEQLQKRTLSILSALSKCNYFPNFVKFLLLPGCINESLYSEAVLGIRNALGWPTSLSKPQDIDTSQILTAAAIRNSIISSKPVANSWIKIISSCKVNADHKPIDFIIMLILYSISEEKQKQVENILKKQIKLNIIKEDLIDDAFDKFLPILKDYLKHLINLTNSLLKSNSEPVLQVFASHIYMLMLSKLLECSQTVVAELLQLGIDNKNCLLSTLKILNNVAAKDMNLLKPQSIQMLMLLDRSDDMSLLEIKAVMNLVCGLAYSYENSIIRDDVHMIIRKELGCSNLFIKMQGILAGTHAVKYLINTDNNEEEIEEPPDDITYGSIDYFPGGDLQEAAQIVELIYRSTRQFPNMITLFYDELCEVINSTNSINKCFLAWIACAATNDLQTNFIVDNIKTEKIGCLKLSLQYCLNTDSEIDEIIAINIGGLTLEENDDVDIFILPPLFHAVQILHVKKYDGDLSSIDALLGCPIIMPIFDVDEMDDMTNSTVINILDCLVHCSNWFRELVNAFASQTDPALRSKIYLRLIHLHKLETLIEQILLKCNFKYNPPSYVIHVKSINGEQKEKTVKITHNTKQKNQKKNKHDESLLPETSRTQATQNNVLSIPKKLSIIGSISFRPLNLSLLNLLNAELTEDLDSESGLTIEVLIYILQYVNPIFEKVLLSKIKRTTFLTKEENVDVYDYVKAEECAKKVNVILPKLIEHLQFITTYLDNHVKGESHNESTLYPSSIFQYVLCLEYIYNFCTIYFRWMGFKNHQIPLLKSSLRSIANLDNDNSISLKDLVFAVAKYLQKHEKYCLQISTAVALIELLMSVKEFNTSNTTHVILRDMANNFLSQSWKTPDGILEKGLAYNQNVDILSRVYFVNSEILSLKNITLMLVNEIEMLKNRNSTLNIFKCINKANFPIIYRNLGIGLQELTKNKLNKGLTNNEHLELWKDVAIILRCMSEISKMLENRNNLTALLKKALPMIKLFIAQGIPILEIEFKNKTQEILEILKILQQTTRFLQSLCCHSRLKKDTALMSKVPYMRQLLETLIYKVKAVLTTNKCSEAFWMGNLKNKNIHGEIIASQDSIEAEESVEDCDDQLPEDSDNTEDELLDPDSKSLSDIV